MKKCIAMSLLCLALCGCESSSNLRKKESTKPEKPAVNINSNGIEFEKSNKEKLQFIQTKSPVDDKFRQSRAEIERQGVLGIVYSKENPCAVVGDRIVSVGDVISGATVVKINPESVEFEVNNKKWTQSVNRNKIDQTIAEMDKRVEENRKERISIYFRQNPDLSERIKNCIQNKEIKIGMTKEQVSLSWGNPADIHRTVSSAGVNEQWVYGDVTSFSNSMRYLYFENGVLTSWQE